MSERVMQTLRLMRDNAAKALEYARAHPDWQADELVVDAIAKRVEEVAELAKYRVPRARREDYPEIPWDQIAGIRDRLVHDYVNTDVDLLRSVVDKDLPYLIARIDRRLGEAEAGPLE